MICVYFLYSYLKCKLCLDDMGIELNKVLVCYVLSKDVFKNHMYLQYENERFWCYGHSF